jgi:hypothetical protein
MPKPLGTHDRPQEETWEFINFETSIQVFLSGRPSGTRKWKLKLSGYVHLELRTKFCCPDSPLFRRVRRGVHYCINHISSASTVKLVHFLPTSRGSGIVAPLVIQLCTIYGDMSQSSGTPSCLRCCCCHTKNSAIPLTSTLSSTRQKETPQ